MKILSLRLSNLASIAGEHIIHFEREPLKNAGLIAITGVTGAGKTTLLDAICLALFDQIPRLQQAENNKKMTDASGDEILVHSTINTLRRGCVQGFAEVEFMAQDGKHYLARWEVKRARLKVDGRIQAVQRMLRCISDGQLISERTKECNEKIAELLGLTFHQFTRAVLLAQSEVTAFLKARDNERADLLEYLTNSDIYSRIGKASFEATKQAHNKVELIQKKMGDQPLLSCEERQSLHDEIQHTQKAISDHQAKQQHVQQQLNWYTEQQKLQQQLEKQHAESLTAQQQLEQFQTEINLLTQLEQFESVRDQFIQQHYLQQQQLEQQRLQQDTQQQLDQLHAQQIIQQQVHDQQREQVLCHEQNLQRCKPYIQQAQQYEHQLSTLSQHIEQQQQKLFTVIAAIQPHDSKRQQIQQQQALLSHQQHSLQRTLQHSIELAYFDAEPQSAIQLLHKAAQLQQRLAQQDIELLRQNPAQQQQRLIDTEQQLTKLQHTYSSLDRLDATLRDQQQQLDKHNKHLIVCERLDDQLKVWAKLEQQHEQVQQRKLEQQQQLTHYQDMLTQAMVSTQTAEVTLKTTRQLAQEQRLLTSQTVKDLRDQLQPEHACMVCGSTQHPFYDPQVLLQSLNQQFDQALQHAEQALAQARQQEHRLHTELTQLQTGLQQQHNMLAQCAQDKLDIFEKIREISPNFYQRLQENEANSTLLAATQRLQDIQQQLTTTKNQLEYTLHSLQTQLKQWQQLEKQQTQLKQFIEKQQELSQLEQQVILPLTADWQRQWRQDAQATQQQLATLIETRLHANQQVKQHDNEQHSLQQQLAHLTMLIEHEQRRQTELEQQINADQTQQQHIRQQLDGLFMQHALSLKVTSSSDWQTQIETQLGQHQQQLAQIEQAKTTLETHQARLLQHVEYCIAEQQKNQQLIKQHGAIIETWQQQHAAFDLTQVDYLLSIETSQKQQLQAKRQHLQHAWQQADHTLTIYRQQAAQHLQAQPAQALIQLQDILNESQVVSQQLDETYTHLKVKKLQDEQQQTQAIEIAQALDKAKTEHHRWDKISSLIGDAKGVTFKKLAQQFHLHMLVELANQQLAALTPRYELRCLNDSLGLSIVDHYMNDEVRPVLSLSGGESFLVSLALALGIANMASGTTKLESLFIDEGFGTLDQSALHVVMDALDRLQSQGRKVILISHITEMHERIPVKIHVIPQGSGASRIEVVG